MCLAQNATATVFDDPVFFKEPQFPQNEKIPIKGRRRVRASCLASLLSLSKTAKCRGTQVVSN